MQFRRELISDISENQQIIFTGWMGRSPQGIEDQITFPLPVALPSIPKVKNDPQLFELRLLNGHCDFY